MTNMNAMHITRSYLILLFASFIFGGCKHEPAENEVPVPNELPIPFGCQLILSGNLDNGDVEESTYDDKRRLIEKKKVIANTYYINQLVLWRKRYKYDVLGRLSFKEEEHYSMGNMQYNNGQLQSYSVYHTHPIYIETGQYHFVYDHGKLSEVSETQDGMTKVVNRIFWKEENIDSIQCFNDKEEVKFTIHVLSYDDKSNVLGKEQDILIQRTNNMQYGHLFSLSANNVLDYVRIIPGGSSSSYSNIYEYSPFGEVIRLTKQRKDFPIPDEHFFFTWDCK